MRGCKHFYQPNRCPVPDCPHHDTRPLYLQLFGRDSNSELAARLYRTNLPAYLAAKKEAIDKNVLPPERVMPRCLQDDPQ